MRRDVPSTRYVDHTGAPLAVSLAANACQKTPDGYVLVGASRLLDEVCPVTTTLPSGSRATSSANDPPRYRIHATLPDGESRPANASSPPCGMLIPPCTSSEVVRPEMNRCPAGSSAIPVALSAAVPPT